jgi:hypothetical protein
MRGDISFMKEEQILLLIPPLRINNKPCWEMKMAVNKNPTPINIRYSVDVTTLSLRDFNCSCIPHHNRNLEYKPTSSIN